MILGVICRLFGQTDWWKAKKEKIHHMYVSIYPPYIYNRVLDNYRKPYFRREIQAIELDESGAVRSRGA